MKQSLIAVLVAVCVQVGAAEFVFPNVIGPAHSNMVRSVQFPIASCPGDMFTTSSQSEEKSYTLDGTNYLITVTYNTGYSMIPAVMGPTCQHYSAEFGVSRLSGGKWELLASFSGQFTHWRCFEDQPADLIKRALGVVALVGTVSEAQARIASCVTNYAAANVWLNMSGIETSRVVNVILSQEEYDVLAADLKDVAAKIEKIRERCRLIKRD